MSKTELRDIINEDIAIRDLEANEGDWVLVTGIRKNRPYNLCHYCTQLRYDGEDELYLYDIGDEMHYHKVTNVVLISDLLGI